MRKDPVEWILRGLYSVVLYILLPITVYHLVWRGFRVREYFRRWDERYASCPSPPANRGSGCTRSRWAKSMPLRRW